MLLLESYSANINSHIMPCSALYITFCQYQIPLRDSGQEWSQWLWALLQTGYGQALQSSCGGTLQFWLIKIQFSFTHLCYLNLYHLNIQTRMLTLLCWYNESESRLFVSYVKSSFYAPKNDNKMKMMSEFLLNIISCLLLVHMLHIDSMYFMCCMYAL